MMFHSGGTNVEITTTAGRLVPVEVSSSDNVGAAMAFGILGSLATAHCQATVESAQPLEADKLAWHQVDRSN